MDYTEFSSDDFICDEYFQNWLINPDQETDDFWNNWLQQHPEKRETVEQARNILMRLTFKEHLPAEGQVQQSLAATLSKIDSSEASSPIKGAKMITFAAIKQVVRIAAIFITLVLTGSVLYYNYWNAKTTISTKYSEVRNLILPDGSRVVLNAHSTLSFYKHQRSDRPRQVWLQGEAFFDVRHINKNKRNVKSSDQFIVSTEDLNVNVLGTSFNVKKRIQGTEVVLAKGKIRLDFSNKKVPPVTMHPGQMVAYGRNQMPLIQSVDPALYTTWIDKRLILREANVKDIIGYIQDYYGYRVILEDTAIGNKKMEGTLLLDDMQDVLFVLSSTLHINIERQKDTLVFSNRK
jgi:transmembrane sensor